MARVARRGEKAEALANLDSPMARARLTALFDTLQHRTTRGEL
jgi:hypothetical protein